MSSNLDVTRCESCNVSESHGAAIVECASCTVRMCTECFAWYCVVCDEPVCEGCVCERYDGSSVCPHHVVERCTKCDDVMDVECEECGPACEVCDLVVRCSYCASVCCDKCKAPFVLQFCHDCGEKLCGRHFAGDSVLCDTCTLTSAAHASMQCREVLGNDVAAIVAGFLSESTLRHYRIDVKWENDIAAMRHKAEAAVEPPCKRRRTDQT